jgi:4-aminobutyrate aminotransferase-like enzyme
LTVDAMVNQYAEEVMTGFGKPFPAVFVTGEGVYLTDVHGKTYLDFWAGIATVNLGHNNPQVQAAVKLQMESLVHCASESYYTLPALELAKTLNLLAPLSDGRSTFHTSGSEANDLAIKLMRRYTQKHEVLTLQGSYHGQTYGARSLGTPVAGYPKAASIGPFLPGIIHVPTPYCYRCSLGHTYPSCHLQCVEIVEDIINFGTSRDVAAFIAEPILGVGGIITPPHEYFRKLKTILDRHNILLHLDEVQTGLGRTGNLWGSQTYDIQPHLITLAKALGNGWPIASVTSSKAISEAFEHGDHFSTWGAHPVMCAAAKATLDYLISNKLWENAEAMGELLLRWLKELEERYTIVGNVRGRGLMIGVEIITDDKTKKPGREECINIRKLCHDQGLIIGIGGFWSNVLRIQPPLIISQDHVDSAMSIFEVAVKTAEKNL